MSLFHVRMSGWWWTAKIFMNKVSLSKRIPLKCCASFGCKSHGRQETPVSLNLELLTLFCSFFSRRFLFAFTQLPFFLYRKTVWHHLQVTLLRTCCPPVIKRKHWSPRYIRKYNLKGTWQQNERHNTFTVHGILKSLPHLLLLHTASAPAPPHPSQSWNYCHGDGDVRETGMVLRVFDRARLGASSSLSISALFWSRPWKLLLRNEAFLSHANHYVRVTVRLLSPQMYSDVNW